MNTGQTIRPTMSATVVVCCVHDRVKRQVTDLAFDTAREKVHLCACCENLFTRPDDVPHYCGPCGGRPVHRVMAPLPNPLGEV
jgi:hypothetical protein